MIYGVNFATIKILMLIMFIKLEIYFLRIFEIVRKLRHTGDIETCDNKKFWHVILIIKFMTQRKVLKMDTIYAWPPK